SLRGKGRDVTRLALAAALSIGCAASKPPPPAGAQAMYENRYAARLQPLLQEVLRFPTVEKNAAAHAAQRAWLQRTAGEIGFTVRDAGKIVEVELAAPQPNAPVLGLLVHGDVQPVDERGWTHPP